MDSTFAKAVESIIKTDIPPGVKDYIFSPPPEARELMLRNICARYHAGTNSLAGYHRDIKPNEFNLDDYLHFPPDFKPPFSSVSSHSSCFSHYSTYFSVFHGATVGSCP